jgi:anoctamin-10
MDSKDKYNKIRSYSTSLFPVFVPVNEVREYYGDEIAMYFFWLNNLQSYLVIPSLLAIVCYVLNTHIYSIENSPVAGIFSLMMAGWGSFYVCQWRRATRGLEYKWDNA